MFTQFMVDRMKVLKVVFKMLREFDIERMVSFGDTIVAASGIPVSALNHAFSAANFGLRLVSKVDRINQNINRYHEAYNLPVHTFQFHVGMHTGTLPSGVVGSHSLCYNIWGPTVNYAIRLSKVAAPNTVVASPITRENLGYLYKVAHLVTDGEYGIDSCFKLIGIKRIKGSSRVSFGGTGSTTVSSHSRRGSSSISSPSDSGEKGTPVSVSPYSSDDG
eukprot:TRINITY_DN5140_c0_g1_i3.p1 TRINITY_DN5140_c0_g1~~TRINITY_DN5140_c0_g1_i3.p1  ORF type:complete len:219 (+),score=27.93 TRINITY_DN5140_c0_g1_i3:107-763(+)